MIVFPQSWEDLWNEQYSICTLTGLESGVTYEVRIRGIIEYSNGTVEVGDWEVFTFETPIPEQEWWGWEIGPFEVRYGQYYPYLNNSNTPLSDSKPTLEIEKLVAIREEESKND